MPFVLVAVSGQRHGTIAACALSALAGQWLWLQCRWLGRGVWCWGCCLRALTWTTCCPHCQVCVQAVCFGFSGVGWVGLCDLHAGHLILLQSVPLVGLGRGERCWGCCHPALTWTLCWLRSQVRMQATWSCCDGVGRVRLCRAGAAA
jgi:hypothetical protein